MFFDEAEQVADEDDASGEDGEVSTCRKPVLRRSRNRRARSVAASPCRNTCRASVSSMTLPTTRRPALAAVIRCIAWVRPSPSSSISR